MSSPATQVHRHARCPTSLRAVSGWGAKLRFRLGVQPATDRQQPDRDTNTLDVRGEAQIVRMNDHDNSAGDGDDDDKDRCDRNGVQVLHHDLSARNPGSVYSLSWFVTGFRSNQAVIA